jgi:peptide/nickel transport system permease protein
MEKLLKIVAQRLALGVLTLIAVSMIIFLGVEALPGDLAQAILGQTATPENLAAFRKQLGLDLPPHVRYFNWLGDIMQGDLGTSLATNRPISDLLGIRFANSLFLALYAATVSVPLAVTLGVLAALYRESFFDKFISTATLTTISFPEFFVGYIVIVVLAVQLQLFPGLANVPADMPFWERIYVVFLPAMTLTLVVIAHMMRMTRASIINLLMSPYIEMATLKGMPRSRIIIRHALPNALSPIINVIIINLAYLVVGVVVVEVVFVYPGLGQLLVDSVANRDLPVVQAACMIFASTYILLNLTADVLSIVCNPRMLHPK